MTLLRRFRPRLIVEVVKDALEACGATIEGLEQLLTEAGYQLFQIDERAALRRIDRLQRLHNQNLAALPRELSDV